MSGNKSSLSLTVIGIALISCGCSVAPEVVDERYVGPAVVHPVTMATASGAIYQETSSISLFEDLKAGRVGDILTVRLVEATIASKSSNTSTSKSSAATITNPTVLGRAISRNGIPLLNGSLGGDNAFDGAGSSNQSNSLEGDITVTIVERLPNGNLRIHGEKWLTLNQGREFIRLSGIIRPYDILPDNSVLSAKVADANISYSSKGVLDAANRMGLISRFFNSIFSGL